MTRHARAFAAAAALATLATLLGACAAHRDHGAQPDGTYCHVYDKYGARACTTVPVPSVAADAEIKQSLPGAADALVVYVVRRSWLDEGGVVTLTVDGARELVTIPHSFARLRLQPGPHTFVARWGGRSVTTALDGKAGQVRFLRLDGGATADASFEWRVDTPKSASLAIRRARLIADLVWP